MEGTGADSHWARLGMLEQGGKEEDKYILYIRWCTRIRVGQGFRSRCLYIYHFISYPPLLDG